MLNWLRNLVGKLKFWSRRPQEVDTPKMDTPKVSKVKQTKEIIPYKEKILPAKNIVLVTSVSNIELIPVKVFDDHTLKWAKKTIQIKPDRPAHILTIPGKLLMGNRLLRRFMPRFIRFNAYTVQQTGELTHDPHLDYLDEEMKLRLEKLLGLMGKFAEVQAGAVVYEGLKGKKKWWDYIPYMAIVAIVFLFLFAYFK